MAFADDFYLSVKEIYIAHKCTLDRENPCAYPKGRGNYGLVYALNGEAEFRFNRGETVKITPRQLLFLLPDNAYSVVTYGKFEHYTVNFSIYENNSKLSICDKNYCFLQSENAEVIERVFKKLVRTWGDKKTGYEMQSAGLLYELLYNFYHHYTEGQSSAAYKRLNTAKEYIEKHYTEPISLSQLAFLSDMSISHFRREWKRFYRESPLQYRDSIRLYYAKEYLWSGYYTIGEIAKKCGFEDVSYFVRFFKKKTGLTPGETKKEFLGK